MAETIKLGINAHNVLFALSDSWVSPFKHIAARTSLPLPIVKRAVHSLAKKGLASLETAFDEDDGLLRGKGYMLTSEGKKLVYALEDEMSVNDTKRKSEC